MSPHRLTTGFIGSALLGGPLLAGVIWAGPAQADAASFINDMHRDGVHAVTGGDAALLQAGSVRSRPTTSSATPNVIFARTASADLTHS